MQPAKNFLLSKILRFIRQEYPLLLMLACLSGLWYAGLNGLLHPLFPYRYNEPTTRVVLGLQFLLLFYGMCLSLHYLGRPHAWRNTAKIFLQLILFDTVIHFVDLHYRVSAYAIMNESLSAEIANAVLPVTTAAVGLYKLYKGHSFSTRQTVFYILAQTLGSQIGTLGVFIRHFLFSN